MVQTTLRITFHISKCYTKIEKSNEILGTRKIPFGTLTNTSLYKCVQVAIDIKLVKITNDKYRIYDASGNYKYLNNKYVGINLD